MATYFRYVPIPAEVQFRRHWRSPYRVEVRKMPAGARTDPFVRRALYEASDFTRKSCAICGEEAFELHHGSYHREDLALLTPLCAEHHREFSTVIWPAMWGHWRRVEATLAYVVHGPALAQHINEWGPLTIQNLRGTPTKTGQLSFDLEVGR